MEVSEEFSSTSKRLIKYTDLPSNLLQSFGTNITRPVEVFNSKEVSDLSRSKDPLTLLRIRSSISKFPITRIWVLRSSGRRKTIISYLFHKWLFGNLSELEKELFFDLHESISNNQIYSSLKARSKGYSMKSIRKALKFSPFLFGLKPPSVERWIGYRTYKLQIEVEIRHVRGKKIMKYSGWRRHQNDQGSLGPQREEPFFLVPYDENDNISLFLNICEQINSGKSEIFLTNFLRIK